MIQSDTQQNPDQYPTMLVAAIQMNSVADTTINLARAEALLAEAADAGARLAVLPENFAIMGNTRADTLAAAEDDGNGPIQECIAAAAQQHGLWVVAGTVPLASSDGQRVRPTSLVFDADGNRVACYDKIHLFDVGVPGSDEAYLESDTFVPGPPEPVLVNTPFGRLGLTVCYDLRFPELYRALAEQGAYLITAPSAFTHTTGQAHWHLLTRVRAVENQVMLIAPNQAGTHANGRRTFGHSLIVDAWGKVQAEAEGTADEVIIAEFDAARQQDIRRDFPVLTHRRLP